MYKDIYGELCKLEYMYTLLILYSGIISHSTGNIILSVERIYYEILRLTYIYYCYFEKLQSKNL